MAADDEPNAQVFLRSLESLQRVSVEFINTTPYVVEVLWIDFKGQASRYTSLNPSQRFAIQTFVTHPWIFVETETKDRFMVEGKDVYFPQARYSSREGEEREDRPQELVHTPVYITMPIYSLRDISLRVIKRHLRHDYHAFSLDLPRRLQYELASMLPRKDNPMNI